MRLCQGTRRDLQMYQQLLRTWLLQEACKLGRGEEGRGRGSGLLLLLRKADGKPLSVLLFWQVLYPVKFARLIITEVSMPFHLHVSACTAALVSLPVLLCYP